MSRRTVANLLLVAGGLLIGIAALVFTAIGWGHVPPGGRAGILAGVAALALSAPWPLARRGMIATSESLAAVGLALTAFDAYLLDTLAAPRHPLSPGHLAVLSAVLAVGWSAYSVAVPPRAPRLAAIAAAQFPLLLGIVAQHRSAAEVSVVFLVTAGADLVAVALLRARRALPETVVAAVFAALAGVWGSAFTLYVAVTYRHLPGALQAGALLVLAAAVALGAAAVTRRVALWPAVLGGAAGVMLAAAPALPIAAAVTRTAGNWAFAGLAATAALGIEAARLLPRPELSRPEPPGSSAPDGGAGLAAAIRRARTALPAFAWLTRRPLAAGAALVLAIDALLVSLPSVLLLTGPAAWTRTWAGLPARTREAFPVALALHATPSAPIGPPSAPIVLGLLALACWRCGARLRLLSAAAIPVAALACFTIPPAVNLPYWAALLTLGLLAAAVLAAGAAPADQLLAGARSATGAATAVVAAAWSLTSPQATIAVTAGLLAAGVAVAAARRSAVSAVTATLVAVAAATGLAVAAPLAYGLPARQAGLAVLAVAALAQLAAAILAPPRPASAPEDSGALRAAAEVFFSGPAGGRPAGHDPRDFWAPRRALTIPAQIGLAAEVAGWVAALAGFGMTLASPSAASLGLLGAGTLLLVAAARPARGALAAVGLVACSVALVTWLATPARPAPEPYALPAAALVLAAGVLRMRRSAGTGSWAGYGPGLAIGLVPSLAAAYADHGVTRTVLVCVAATGLALAGARARLRAPLVLGVTVAVLAAARELAPLAARLNGWIYVAALGLLLLGAGATYEARLRDLRRLGTALRRLR